MSSLAHIIPTHERPAVCQRLVDSIRQHLPGEVYVCDDSTEPSSYDGALDVPAGAYDIGLSAKRNKLVAATTAGVLWLWDDDYVATPDTDVRAFLDVLRAKCDVGVVAGEWKKPGRRRSRWFTGTHWPDGPIRRTQPPQEPPATVNGWRVHDVDFAANWLVFDRRVAEVCPWDETLKLQEHAEWFARLSACRAKQGASYSDRDAKWLQRYRAREDGDVETPRDEHGRVEVYATTTFRNQRELAHVGGKARGGEWVALRPAYAKKMQRRGYVQGTVPAADARPFPLPSQDELGGVPLAVGLTVDTTCLHDRVQPAGYHARRDRDFTVAKQQKMGAAQEDFRQWNRYPHGEPDWSQPDLLPHQQL
jgi:hypothetical protein